MDDYHDNLSQSQSKFPPVVSRMTESFAELKELPRLLKISKKKFKKDGDTFSFLDNVRRIRATEFVSFFDKESFDNDKPWKTVVLNSTNQESQIYEDNPDLFENFTITNRVNQRVIVIPKKIYIRKQMTSIPQSSRAFY